MEDAPPARAKRKSTPLEDGAVAAMLSFWGVLFLFGPRYVGSAGDWQWGTNVLGILFLAIGIAGALTEAGALWKNEAVTEWGVGAAFLVPAALVHVALEVDGGTGWRLRLGRISVLVLLAFGVPFLFRGLAHALERPQAAVTLSADEQRERRLDALKTLASVAVAVLSLVTLLLKFVLSL